MQHTPVSAVKLSWLVLLWFCFVVWCPAEDPWCCSCLLSHLQLIWSSAQTLLVSLLVSLLAARLFRLLDVGRGLSASAPTCDSSLLCLRWLCFPPRLIDSSGSATCLHSSVWHWPKPQLTPLWVSPPLHLLIHLLNHLLHHLLNLEPFSLPSERAVTVNDFNHLPVLVSAFRSHKQKIKKSLTVHIIALHIYKIYFQHKSMWIYLILQFAPFICFIKMRDEWSDILHVVTEMTD